MKIGIIGSGLASISAAIKLVEKGYRPIIYDVGLELDPERKLVKKKMSEMSSDQWSKQDIGFISSNKTTGRKSIPKKMVFGSDYFYGKSSENFPVEDEGGGIPFSHAKGGYSAGWGASALPPDDCDLVNWPIDNHSLSPFFKEILNENHYSAVEDDLSLSFPKYSTRNDYLKVHSGFRRAIEKYKKNKSLADKNRYLLGQARLMINADETDREHGCKYCGFCMSGCVYESIYRSERDLDELIRLNKVEYKQNCFVSSFSEDKNGVEINYKDSDGNLFNDKLDKLLIGAGATASTALVMASKKIFNQEVKMKSTFSIVAPMLTYLPIGYSWPKLNTLPSLFLEFKIPQISSNWIHTQISSVNEIVFDKLGIDHTSKNMMHKALVGLSNFSAMAYMNLHSSLANGYSIKLERFSGREEYKLITKRDLDLPIQNITKIAVNELSSIMMKLGFVVVKKMVQDSMNNGRHHIGGTMPMRQNPLDELDTDVLGRPKSLERVHVIDSSTFPSIPGTTLGLLIMANSRRIADNIF